MSELKELLEKATPRPWKVGYNDGSGIAGGRQEYTSIVTEALEPGGSLPIQEVAQCHRRLYLEDNGTPTPNAQLICHLVNKAPQIEALVSACKDYQESYGYVDVGTAA